MKKFLITFFALFVIFSFALPCFAQETQGPEITPTTPEVSEGDVVHPQPSQDTAGEIYASEESIAEVVQDYLLEHWDAITVAGYVVYQLVPKIGGIAKRKKQSAMINSTLDTYFGNENSGTNVFAVQKSTAKAQEKFMNDADAALEALKKAIEPVADFIQQSKDTEQAREATAKIALAVESAVELMANQFNDLVLCSPSINVKKKDEIAVAWLEKKKELHALVETVVSKDDDKNEM